MQSALIDIASLRNVSILVHVLIFEDVGCIWIFMYRLPYSDENVDKVI